MIKPNEWLISALVIISGGISISRFSTASEIFRCATTFKEGMGKVILTDQRTLVLSLRYQNRDHSCRTKIREIQDKRKGVSPRFEVDFTVLKCDTLGNDSQANLLRRNSSLTISLRPSTQPKATLFWLNQEQVGTCEVEFFDQRGLTEISAAFVSSYMRP